MARQRKIDEIQALEAAMVTFWQHGYKGMGTRELEKLTGITRFTLQESYGGKEGLFLQALDAYLNDMDKSFFDSMHGGTLEDLAHWFEQLSDPKSAPQAACYGCFMINSMIEFAGTNEGVSAAQTRFFEMLQQNFETALERVKSRGELPFGFDVDAHVQVLASASIGLNVANRAAHSLEAGAAITHGIASMIRGWAG